MKQIKWIGSILDYFDRMALRLKGEEIGVPVELNSKKSLRNFARLIGVDTSIVFNETSAEQLYDVNFPREFVLKPTFASTSIGVRLLRKIDDSEFIDLIANSVITLDELVFDCCRVAERYFNHHSEGTFLIEELLRDTNGNFPPSDIRVFSFQGEIGLIIMEDHLSGTATASYFNPDFSEMEKVEERFGIAPSATSLERILPRTPPENAEEILSVAARVSTATPTAFCRVDLYNTSRGVILGEITLFPGTFYYKNRKIMHKQDAIRLGKLWELAFNRLEGSELEAASGIPPKL